MSPLTCSILVLSLSCLQPKDEEPDYYVSVPGMRRQASAVTARAAPAAAAPSAKQESAKHKQEAADLLVAPRTKSAPAASALMPRPDAAAVGAASPLPLQRHGSRSSGAASGSGSLLRSISHNAATLGSGTTVHGFKGLFRTVINRSSS
jgi:hypothetical protein